MLNIFHKEKIEKPFWEVDFHSHVCPGIDDGSPDAERSLALVEGMRELGFRGMVLTPHIAEEEFPNTRETIDRSYGRLREALASSGSDMITGVSAEYRMDSGFIHMMDAGTLRPLPGGKHILVENSWFQEPAGIESIAYELRDKFGYVPILAHPERYTYYHPRPQRYKELTDMGVMLQVNILSLSGYYGKDVKRIGKSLVSEGLVSFLGSDLHRRAHLSAIREYFASPDYRKFLKQSPRILNDEVFADFLQKP